MPDELTIQTDTATLAVFDPSCLEHRDTDECDWWSDPAEELKEVRSGAALFIALGADGGYTIRVQLNEHLRDPSLAARVRCESGSIFIGPGEDTPGAGAFPGTDLGGAFYSLEPATYLVALKRLDAQVVLASLHAVPGVAQNEVAEPLELPWPTV